VRRARHPSLYQVNTRIWLGELSRRLGRVGTLDDTPDADLDTLASLGFDWLWPLGVWQTGPAGRAISWAHPDWRLEYSELLPGFTADDVTGSPFAVQAYSVHRDFGGDAALSRLRARLAARGIQLMLDFVPNHSALDHPWIVEHPEFYIGGTDDDLAREPHNWFRAPHHGVVAHGRDPFFPGWPDSAQLNYRCEGLRFAMTEELLRVADRCDGVRCDMAMLLLPDVIERTWGSRSLPTDDSPPVDRLWWPEAIAAVRTRHPQFTFVAEVYWDREWDLQQLGFDYTYDKRLYDRLRQQEAVEVLGHLHADADFMRRSVRFLENHDEVRAAGIFPIDVHRAAATIAHLVPGMRLIHDGQTQGRTKRASIHLNRQLEEPTQIEVADFYGRLLAVMRLPAVRDGEWRLANVRPAWDSNPTHRQFVAFSWQSTPAERLLVAVNYSPTPGQCYVELPWSDIRGKTLSLTDRLSEAQFERDGDDLGARGLYLDVPPWQAHAFAVAFG
jgi:glycosidase